jgi:hypothetical protein
LANAPGQSRNSSDLSGGEMAIGLRVSLAEAGICFLTAGIRGAFSVAGWPAFGLGVNSTMNRDA